MVDGPILARMSEETGGLGLGGSARMMPPSRLAQHMPGLSPSAMTRITLAIGQSPQGWCGGHTGTRDPVTRSPLKPRPAAAGYQAMAEGFVSLKRDVTVRKRQPLRCLRDNQHRRHLTKKRLRSFGQAHACSENRFLPERAFRLAQKKGELPECGELRIGSRQFLETIIARFLVTYIVIDDQDFCQKQIAPSLRS